MERGAMKPKKRALTRLVKKLQKEVTALLESEDTSIENLQKLTLAQTNLSVALRRLDNIKNSRPEYGDEEVRQPCVIKVPIPTELL